MLMNSKSRNQRLREAKGMRQFLGQGESLVAPPQGLVWIAKRPQGPGYMGEARYCRVLAAAENMGAVLLGIVEGKGLL
jgi:hypothetical protein